MPPELTAIVAIVVAAVPVLGVVAGHTVRRLNDVEAQVVAARDETSRARAYNRRLWVYTRDLIDLYYRHRTPDAPNPPPLPEED